MLLGKYNFLHITHLRWLQFRTILLRGMPITRSLFFLTQNCIEFILNTCCRIWDYRISCEAIEVIQHHSEFVYGLDFNIHSEGEMADCGWDSLVHVFTPKTFNSVTK